MTQEKSKKEEKESFSGAEYFAGVGKRKTAIAQVRIYVAKELGEILVNDRKLSKYFKIERLCELVRSPLGLVGEGNNFSATIKVSGGGFNAQAEAVRLGISRALLKFDESLRKPLKDNGFLTRDSRIVERKKAGLKKARRAPQWAKR